MKKLSAIAVLAMAALPAIAEVTISGAPAADTLVTSLENAYAAAVGLGIGVLGVGLVIYLIRRGIKAK